MNFKNTKDKILRLILSTFIFMINNFKTGTVTDFKTIILYKWIALNPVLIMISLILKDNETVNKTAYISNLLYWVFVAIQIVI